MLIQLLKVEINSQICCPVAEYLNQPDAEEEECEGCEDYTCAPSELNGDPDKCPAESQCVAISKCGKQEFLKDAPPTTCGYTESGEDMICCSGKYSCFNFSEFKLPFQVI